MAAGGVFCRRFFTAEAAEDAESAEGCSSLSAVKGGSLDTMLGLYLPVLPWIVLACNPALKIAFMPDLLSRSLRSRIAGNCLIALTVVSAVGIANAAEPPDFAKSGRAYLEKHCLECHRGSDAKAELSLDRFRDSMSIVKQRKTWENVARMITSGQMPPEDHPQPTPLESETFTQLIEDIFRHSDQNAKPDPGRVTMRRLNRVEYRNTIRDLIGVDFDPTEDFPSDDIGHGFDNIGDVLTLSPVLMERYMAAAESIVQRAIFPEPPPVPKRRISTRYAEPASAEVEKTLMVGKFRRMSSDAKDAVASGPLNSPYQWAADGEYVFRTRAYAKCEDGQTVRVALMVQGESLQDASPESELASWVGEFKRPTKILKLVEVSAAREEEAAEFEVAVPPMTGRERMLVAIEKQPDGKPPVELFVEYLALEGPLDTRPATQRRLLAASPDKSQAEQTREVLSRFLRRAYRRPPSEQELERMATFVEQAISAGEKWEGAMQMAIQATLCSPKFLFRVELDDRPESGQAERLDEFQLASRLSYFLWSTMPDDTLLDLAADGQLTANLDAQVGRMLADEKASALVQQFAVQWLQIQRLATFSPDAKLFPSFDEPLRQAMLTETELFFESIVKEDRSVLDLLDADYTFLNEPLARHYGIIDTNGNRAGQPPAEPKGEPIRGEKFTRVSLRDKQRGGLLTQASVLTVTSNPTRTSPVKRGRWVLEQILGAPPPPPPPNVPELPEGESAKVGGTLKERLEVHRQNPSCANCHAKMDPIGFSLENYDAIGGFRTKDGEFDIDPSGEFADGKSVRGPDGLKAVLREKQTEFVRCLVEKLLIYSLGRGLEYYDRPAVERIVQALETNDYRFSVLVSSIANSDPFRFRRNASDTDSEGN